LTDGRHVIGRDAEADVHIAHISVSRRHAVIEHSTEGTWLIDADSTNGTWINGQRLVGSRALSDGDQIRLGEVELRFYDPANSLTDPIGAPITHIRALTSGVPGVLPLPPAVSPPVISSEISSAPRRRRVWLLIAAGLLLVAGAVGAYLGIPR